MSKLSIFHYCIALATLLGFARIGRLDNLLKTFPFFLLLTLFVECATPFKIVKFNGNNAWWFNVFTTIEFIYYSYLFYHILERPSVRTIMPWAVLGLFIFTVINIFFIQGIERFHTNSARVGGIMIIIWCLFYFQQLMRSTERLVLGRNPYFWISTGLLFFYCGIFFYFTAYDDIVYKNEPGSLKLWSLLSSTLNTLLYSCFALAMVCKKRRS